jgi:hypothetical protein
MRGKMLLICPTSQANASATHWHDGQISLRASLRCQLKVSLVPDATQRATLLRLLSSPPGARLHGPGSRSAFALLVRDAS